jgi:hypothetical protein
MAESTQTLAAKAQRRAELTDRLPVLLACLVGEIANDAGDNPATHVLAAVALENARELAELEATHVQA